MWEAFHDDFVTFTLQNFQSANPNAIRNLRAHLRKNGVYVQAGRGIQVATALYKVLEEDIPSEWSEEEIRAQLDGGFNSIHLNRLQSQYQTLPTTPQPQIRYPTLPSSSIRLQRTNEQAIEDQEEMFYQVPSPSPQSQPKGLRGTLGHHAHHHRISFPTPPQADQVAEQKSFRRSQV